MEAFIRWGNVGKKNSQFCPKEFDRQLYRSLNKEGGIGFCNGIIKGQTDGGEKSHG
jgi:hypothetical protein